MKKQIKKLTGGLLLTGLLVTGMTTGATVYGAYTESGAAGAATDTEYSLEEMLVYAIEDEYLAQAEYALIMETYGVGKSFSNIVTSEATHISLLKPLLEEYGVVVPEKDFESLVAVPESLEASYVTGVEAEENNIAMYESFLKEDLPYEVREVFETLLNASKRHLVAFQRQVDGVTCGSGNGAGNRSGAGRQKGNRGGCGVGKGNQSALQGSCIVN